MASTERTILSALKTLLRANHTTATPIGTYDLSGTDQVKIGRYMHPPIAGLPFVAIAAPTTEGVPDAATLQNHAYVARYDVQGWVPASTLDPEARALAACDLQSDIAMAVKNARRNTGGSLKAINAIRNISWAFTVIDGDEGDLAPGYAVVFGTISVEFAQDRGL